jgi:hypothetical protein
MFLNRKMDKTIVEWINQREIEPECSIGLQRAQIVTHDQLNTMRHTFTLKVFKIIIKIYLEIILLFRVMMDALTAFVGITQEGKQKTF